jgi:hypothetical protein
VNGSAFAAALAMVMPAEPSAIEVAIAKLREQTADLERRISTIEAYLAEIVEHLSLSIPPFTNPGGRITHPDIPKS